MEALKEIIPLVFAGSLFALILAVGLDAELDDLLSLFRRPLRLLKAVLAVNVIVPVVALALVTLFPISLVAKAGILLMAISPVPPLVPGKELKVGGDKSYAYGLYTALILLAIVVVPVSVAILDRIYPREIILPVSAVAKNVALTVILPLLLGLLIRRFAPTLAVKAAGVLRKVAMIALVVALVPILVTTWPAFQSLLGDGTVLVMALVAVFALIGGHLLGGPAPRDRAALAVTAATRHPGIALLIAKTNFDDHRISAAIIGFMLVGMLAGVPYQMMIKRQIARA